MNTNSIPGNSKTPNEIQAFRLVWNDVTIFIKWEPEAFGGVIAHLEMMSEDRVAFPISETGYRSHFCHRSEVESCGGPVDFVRLWLEQEGGKQKKGGSGKSTSNIGQKTLFFQNNSRPQKSDHSSNHQSFETGGSQTSEDPKQGRRGMAKPSRDVALAAFKQTFRQLAPYKHRYEVFRDFVTMAACSLHNSLHKDEAREEEYLRIIGQYKPDDQQAFPKLMAQLVAALDEEPRDILGPLYMELEIANKDAGQFFTPPELSELMARMTFSQELDKLETQDFITAGEPAAGAGGMILALVKVMISAGHNPAEKLWVQAIDLDRMAALMCYIQLSLWNVPAEVIVGNTLSWDIREVWYTPAHHLGLWKYRLRRKEGSAEVAPAPKEQAPKPAATPEAPGAREEQLGFDF